MHSTKVGVLFAISLLAGPVLAESTADERRKRAVARLGGAEITEDDLGIRAELMRLELQAYQAKLQAIERIAASKLLERAAKDEGLGVMEYLAKRTGQESPEPARAELEAFYLAQREAWKEPFEKVEDRVSESYRAARTQQLRAKLLVDLKAKYPLELLLDPPRVALSAGSAPRLGKTDSRVTIVEFSDYLCPYCKRTQPVLREVLSKYGDEVSLVFKDMPLRIHPEAQQAAEAARCAGDQGKFWAFHERLFNSSSLSLEMLKKVGRETGLDETAFHTCVTSRKHQAALMSDMREGEVAGVQSTPTFYVNGIPLVGAQTVDSFSKVIDSELRRAR
jgi:protein-disulfide isomerase